MRILLVNKFIFPKGGAETYTFDVGKMLEEHGHEVQYFGLENEKNIVGNRVDSYVTNMDFSQGIYDVRKCRTLLQENSSYIFVYGSCGCNKSSIELYIYSLFRLCSCCVYNDCVVCCCVDFTYFLC